VPDYDTIFALRDNPFSPEPEALCPEPGSQEVPEWGATSKVSSSPLRIHRASMLEKLFVKEAGPIEQYINLFHKEMEKRKFSKVQARAPQVSLRFLISGPVGSGKTTLANYLASQLKQYLLPSGKAWKVVDYRDVARSETMDSAKRIEEIVQQCETKVTEGNYGCLILDDLEAADESRVANRLDALTRDRGIVAFLIARANSTFGQSAVARTSHSAEFALALLEQVEAIKFVERRLNWAREEVKNPPPWIEKECPLFPFDQDSIETGVKLGVLGTKTDKKARPAIRDLGMLLAQALEEEAEKRGRAGDPGIRAIKRADLNGRMINILKYVVELTERVVGKTGRA
jgi:hypothetical protein